MRRVFLLVLIALAFLVWGAVFALARPVPAPDLTLPTLFILPTLTPSHTHTATLTATATPTPTPTPTDTATFTPTLTPTPGERLLAVVAVMPGVYLPPTPTPFPRGTILLPAPPEPLEPLPDATHSPPEVGWLIYESDHPRVQYAGNWSPRLHRDASRGQYHRAEDVHSVATFTFTGDAFRLRYVAARNMGRFEVLVDGVLIDTLDAYAPELTFPATRTYVVGSGTHTLTVRNAQTRHPASEGYVVGLDAIQVYHRPANVLIFPPERVEPTAEPLPAREVRLLSAPPEPRPTTTPIPPAVVRVSVVIAYDENGNKAVDPAEGVAGIPVRVVESGTNRVLASTLTDARGHAALAVIADAPARVVVPYFGRVWELPRGRAGQASFSLLLAPGTQPGLIP